MIKQSDVSQEKLLSEGQSRDNANYGSDTVVTSDQAGQ